MKDTNELNLKVYLTKYTKFDFLITFVQVELLKQDEGKEMEKLNKVYAALD